MATTITTRPRIISTQERQASDYTELARRVKDAGLLRRRPGWYLARCLTLAACYLGGMVAFFAIGQSPWQLLLALGFAILFTQTAYLSHDSAHRQVFVSGKRNEWFSRIVGNLFVGLSYGWWMNKHSKHHANPNTIGKDGDIGPGALVFVPEDAVTRSGFAAWFGARQGYFFFPILLFAGLELHVNAVRTLLGRAPFPHRTAELILLAVRLIGFPILVLLTLGPALGLAFLAIQIAAFGVYMGASFAPNHKGMPIVPANAKIDFLRRQVLLSRNIRGNALLTAGMGGLNYQVEHHLFPSMPSVNLPLVQPIVREYCRERGVAYTETGLFESYGIVIRYLNQAGAGHGDPFECPIAAQYR